jgi:hypothetical protein
VKYTCGREPAGDSIIEAGETNVADISFASAIFVDGRIFLT